MSGHFQINAGVPLSKALTHSDTSALVILDAHFSSLGLIVFFFLFSFKHSFGEPRYLQVRGLLLCAAAIQRIEVLGQRSRLAVIILNKKQTLKHMVPLDEAPRVWEGNVVFPTFPSGLEAPVSLLAFHLSCFYCITSDCGAGSCLYSVSINFLFHAGSRPAICSSSCSTVALMY